MKKLIFFALLSLTRLNFCAEKRQNFDSRQDTEISYLEKTFRNKLHVRCYDCFSMMSFCAVAIGVCFYKGFYNSLKYINKNKRT